MVVLLHFKTRGLISTASLVSNSFLFVDFFFVLSGFVIAASYGERLSSGFAIRKFIMLRLGRIYPLHLTMLLLFLSFEIVMSLGLLGSADRQPFVGINSPGMFVASLLLIQTFLGADGTYWNGPSWSIAVEMWTYLLFAFGLRYLGRAIVPVSLVLAAACALYVTSATDRYLNVFHHAALARCLFGFALGMMAFRLHSRLPTRLWGPILATALELVAVAAVIGMVIVAASGPVTLAIPPLFFCVVLLFARQGGVVSGLLGTRPFLLLGMLSYSIYMIHAFIEYRLLNVLALIGRVSHGRLSLIAIENGHAMIGGSPLFGDVMSFVMLAITILCAYATYRLIEKPGQKWSRDKVLGTRPRRVETVAEGEAPTF